VPESDSEIFSFGEQANLNYLAPDLVRLLKKSIVATLNQALNLALNQVQGLMISGSGSKDFRVS
jgi:hypothetical protein